MCFKKISKVFQECFNEVLFCDFVVADLIAATRTEGGLVSFVRNTHLIHSERKIVVSE